MCWHRLGLLAIALSMLALGACKKEEALEETPATTDVDTTVAEPLTTDPATTDTTDTTATTDTTDLSTDMETTDSGSPSGPTGIGASADQSPSGRANPLQLFHQNAGLHGDRLTYYQAPTWQKCQEDCQKREDCRGWTLIRKGAYDPPDRPADRRTPAMCYLMQKATGWQRSPCCISGVKDGLPADPADVPP